MLGAVIEIASYRRGRLRFYMIAAAANLLLSACEQNNCGDGVARPSGSFLVNRSVAMTDSTGVNIQRLDFDSFGAVTISYEVSGVTFQETWAVTGNESP